MKPAPLRLAVFKHGLKTWGLMLVLLTPIVLLSEHMPDWLFYLLFLGIFLVIVMPFHFGLGPLGRRFGRAVNDAAVLEDKEYRRSLGPEAHSRKPDSAEKNN